MGNHWTVQQHQQRSLTILPEVDISADYLPETPQRSRERWSFRVSLSLAVYSCSDACVQSKFICYEVSSQHPLSHTHTHTHTLPTHMHCTPVLDSNLVAREVFIKGWSGPTMLGIHIETLIALSIEIWRCRNASLHI